MDQETTNAAKPDENKKPSSVVADASTVESQILAGRKVFFVMPNISVFPDNFCEYFLGEGFECYFMLKDMSMTLQDRIEIFIQYFKDVLFIFNIDATPVSPDVPWELFIEKLHAAYPDVGIGVMYNKKVVEGQVAEMKSVFNQNIGVNCGYVEIDFDRNHNYMEAINVLQNCGAKGRRKSVRAVCFASCNVAFEYAGEAFNEAIDDISLSHFTITLDPQRKIPLDYELIRNMALNIKGFRFKSDAILCLKRENSDGGIICVFMFVDERQQQRLEMDTKANLIPKLYDIKLTNCMNMFDKIVEEREKRGFLPKIDLPL